MVCKKCRRTLNSDFKVCPYCGNTNQSSTEYGGHDIFSVDGRHIVVSFSLIEYKNLRKRFTDRAEKLEHEFIDFYKARTHTFNDLFDKEIPEAEQKVFSAVQFGVSVLMEYGIDDIDTATLMTIVRKRDDIKKTLTPIAQKAKEIYDLEQFLEEYRDAQKSGRGHWEGGGFGLGGAIKGAVMAGALNLGSDMLHGIGDSFQSGNHKAKISDLKKELATSPETFQMLTDAVYFHCVSVFYSVRDILLENKCIPPVTIETKKAFARANNYLDQYKAHRDNETIYAQTMDVLCECIQMSPFDADLYYFLYSTTKGQKLEIHELAKYFGVERDYRNLLVKTDASWLNMIKAEDENTIEELEKKLDDLNLLLKENPYIEAADYLKELSRKVEDHKKIIGYQTEADSAVENNDIDLLWQYADSGNVYAESKLLNYYQRLYRAGKEAGLSTDSLLQPVIERSNAGNPLAAFIIAYVRNKEHEPEIIQLVRECYKNRKYAVPIFYTGKYAIDNKDWDKIGITKQETVWFIDRAADMLLPSALDKAYDIFLSGKWFIVNADNVRAERYDQLRKLYSVESRKKNLQVDLPVQIHEDNSCTTIQEEPTTISEAQVFPAQIDVKMTEHEIIAQQEPIPPEEQSSQIHSGQDIPHIGEQSEITGSAVTITSSDMKSIPDLPSIIYSNENTKPNLDVAKKSKILAGILAILLGLYGAHWFYLGHPKRGLFYIAIFVVSFLFAAVFPGAFFLYLLFCIGEGLFFWFSKREKFENYISTQKKTR